MEGYAPRPCLKQFFVLFPFTLLGLLVDSPGISDPYVIFNMYEIGLHTYQKTASIDARNSEFLRLSTVAVTKVCSIFKKFTK